ncbi:MAG TPA: hypothetical protein VGS20_13025 [Candidatus Acidoferrales bacterium]|nr:hypothetical protein [Candidatus Acidoferrales bacterium]
MRKLFARLWQEECGQDLAEYVLVVVLISLGAIATMQGLAKAISDTFTSASVKVTQAGS